jgi:hypothetical protein
MTRSYIQANEGKLVYISGGSRSGMGGGFGLIGVVHRGVCYAASSKPVGNVDSKIVLHPVSEDLLRDLSPIDPKTDTERALLEYLKSKSTRNEIPGSARVSIDMKVEVDNDSACS